MSASKKDIARRAGLALTTMQQTGARLWESRHYADSDRLAQATSTMMGVLNQSGIGCHCKVESRSVHGPQMYCKCAPLTARAAGRKKGLKLQRQKATFRGLWFDGEHCRDGSGAFVPVSQCKGPVGRDPRSGRFVSIK